MTDQRPSSTAVPLSGILLLAGLMVFWGVNWPAMKIVVAEIPVPTFRVACVLVGGVTLLGVAVATRQTVWPARQIWPALIGVSMVNVALWQVLSATGLIYLPAGRGAIIAFTMPIWASILSSLFLAEPFTRRKGAGLALGIAGLGVLVGPEVAALGAAPLGVVIMVAAAMCWAAGTVWMKRVDWRLSTVALTGWQLLLAGIPIGLWALAIGLETEIGPLSEAAMIAAAYAVIVPMTLCCWAWFTVVKIMPAAIAAIGTLGIPVVGVLSGAVVLGEPVGAPEILALLLVVAGLAVVLIPPRVPARKTP